MNYVPKINRRAFVVGSAAAGGLALGFGLPTTALAATGDRAQFAENLTPNELGIWVAVKPDDTVAIRVVRAEMGQGSQTGLAQSGVLHKVQKAWIDHDVPQCGYCQSGMIMAAVELLKNKPKPTDADIDREMTNICRCGTFQQVRAAIHAAASA